MDNLVGKRVIYNSDYQYDKFYPPKGTRGVILSVITYGHAAEVQWDYGTKPGSWYCPIDRLTFVEDNNE